MREHAIKKAPDVQIETEVSEPVSRSGCRCPAIGLDPAPRQRRAAVPVRCWLFLCVPAAQPRLGSSASRTSRQSPAHAAGEARRCSALVWAYLPPLLRRHPPPRCSTCTSASSCRAARMTSCVVLVLEPRADRRASECCYGEARRHRRALRPARLARAARHRRRHGGLHASFVAGACSSDCRLDLRRTGRDLFAQGWMRSRRCFSS